MVEWGTTGTGLTGTVRLSQSGFGQTRVFRSWVAIMEKDAPQDEKSVRYVKKSACLSEASLQILITC